MIKTYVLTSLVLAAIIFMSEKYPSSRAGSKEKVVLRIVSFGSSNTFLQCNVPHSSHVREISPFGSMTLTYK